MNYLNNAQRDLIFEKLLADYRAMIYHIISKSCLGDSEKINHDDLFQEGCIALYEASLSYQVGSKASFSTYAYILIKRKIMHYLRKDYRYRSREAYSLDSSIEHDHDLNLKENKEIYDPIKQLEKKETMLALHEFISSLSLEDRQIIMMRNDGISYKEIAENLGISPKRVDNRLNNIRRRFRKRREEDDFI